MTHHRPAQVVSLLLTSVLLGSAALTAVPASATAALPAPATPPGITARYLSGPPPLAAERPGPERSAAAVPPSAPTRGRVIGRVLTPGGKPFAGALVQGVRYSDLGRGIDFAKESPVLARTDAQGWFRLPQLTERYLVRVCDAARGAQQCGGDDAPNRWAPTYRGPDGVSASWVTQTRLYAPTLPTRVFPTLTMVRYATLAGTVHGAGPGVTVHLQRGNGTEAATARTDARGRYRFSVVPGRYRVEVDRHEGLRTVDTVPGYRSGWLRLTAASPTTRDVNTRAAATVTGRLTVAGAPVAERLVVVTDVKGRWAAGTVTDEDGRYRIESLKAGDYRVGTLAASSTELPVQRSVTLTLGGVVRADLQTSAGGAVRFAVTDGTGTQGVDVEVRDERGRLVKAAEARPGEQLGFLGLPAGTYQLVARRAADPDVVDPVLPWAQRVFTVSGARTVSLGRIALDQATLTLSGTLPKGAQVKLAPVPSDAVLRPGFVSGPSATAMSMGWTEQADSRGRYTSVGLVPGRYAVIVSTALRSPAEGPSTTGGNVAVTHAVVEVGTRSVVADFSAPTGGVLTGRLVEARTGRPLIAPVGYRAGDRGDKSSLFPTVSGPQRFDRGFRVTRLHAGPVTGALLDVDALGALLEQDVLIPDTLLESAPVAERGTPYWLAAATRTATVSAGEVTDLGRIEVTVRQ